MCALPRLANTIFLAYQKKNCYNKKERNVCFLMIGYFLGFRAARAAPNWFVVKTIQKSMIKFLEMNGI